MEKYLVYNHPAVAPQNIKVDKVYLLEELEEIFTFEEIECFFKPENFEWEDVE